MDKKEIKKYVDQYLHQRQSKKTLLVVLGVAAGVATVAAANAIRKKVTRKMNKSLLDAIDNHAQKENMVDMHPKTNGVVPVGCLYKSPSTNKTYNPGDELPESCKDGDIFRDGEYEYRYNELWMPDWVPAYSVVNGWSARVLDDSKMTYNPMYQSINNAPVNALSFTFYNCSNMIVSPPLPQSVTKLHGTFANCSALLVAPEIPKNAENLCWAFSNCESLETVLPVPATVKNMQGTFENCKSLEGTLVIDANPEVYDRCFANANLLSVQLEGKSDKLNELKETSHEQKLEAETQEECQPEVSAEPKEECNPEPNDK